MRQGDFESLARRERELFERFVLAERARIRTWQRTGDAVAKLLAAFHERRSLTASADHQQVMRMLLELHAGNALATRALVLGCWRGWYRFLEAEGHLLAVKPAELKVKGPIRSFPTRVLSVTEVARWLALCDPRCPWGLLDKTMLETVYGCGLRAGELWALELDSLDLGAATLTVRTSKNGDGRALPLPDQTRTALTSYLAQRKPSPGNERWLWVGPDGARVPQHYLKYRIRTVYRPALEFGSKLSQRALRHSFATHLLQSGAGVRHIGALLGHRDPRSTGIYTKVRPEEVKQALIRAREKLGLCSSSCSSNGV
jgi:integrase/recombinase XerD